MTIKHMRIFLVLAVLAGCDGDEGPPDAAPDAVATLDCPTYCDRIQMNCTGANAQYSDRDHCIAACGTFTVGTSTVTDVSGNTLGCRVYYSGAPSKMDPATHCAQAGPGGDPIGASSTATCSGGDVCASFCALEIKACGSLEEPLDGDPRDDNGNPLFQYRNLQRCMENCATFDKTHAYSTAAAGNSLACRLLHATRAAITTNAKMECAYTGLPPTGPCAGTPTP
jgi:hypothetical protein